MLSAAVQRGISVIETMIVVALVVILLVLALPAGMEWIANQRIRTAAESLAAGLQLARMEAVRRNAVVEFVLANAATTAWTVRTAAGEEVQRRAAGEGTADVTVAVTPVDATRVSFDGLGRRTANADGSPSIERIAVDLPVDVLPADRTRDLRLQVGVGGQIVMCDPNVTSGDDVRRCP
ncbi:MAG: GspH/FimT family pseudopilin [Pseudomonadota bacterium]|jgi:type IV fimbrial biogenesis protein FimT